MDHTTQAARVLMGDSLGFHIIFVLFGLTFPIITSVFELRGILKKNDEDIRVARFWAKIMGLLVITGVVSGTVIALQMSLVWPGILKFGGEVIGLPFMFETYAFLIEATFLALYLTTWGKVRPLMHWVFGLFVVIGSTLSAFAITSVNAWMNYPSGFEYINGKIEHVNVWAAMFSRTSIVEFIHSMPGYYLAATLFIAGLYAIRLARKKSAGRTSTSSKLDWRIIHTLLIIATLSFIASGITGDITGKYLATHEPDKLAAIEVNMETRGNAPLVIGGIADADGNLKGPHLKVPGGLSLLAGNSTGHVVRGLNETPKNRRPSLFLHTLFDIKMTLLDAMAAVLVAYWVLYFLKKKQWLANRYYLTLVGVIGLSGIAMVEVGWMITEIGRQPWAVRGYVLTQDAITKSRGVEQLGYIFPAAFLLLLAVTALATRKIVRDEAQTKGGTL